MKGIFLRKDPLVSFLSLSFHEGCTLNRYVDWDWVCRTNTLGWEQCDLNKREAETAEVRGAEAEEEHEDEENQPLPEVVYVAQAAAKEIIQSALEEAQE